MGGTVCLGPEQHQDSRRGGPKTGMAGERTEQGGESRLPFQVAVALLGPPGVRHDVCVVDGQDIHGFFKLKHVNNYCI